MTETALEKAVEKVFSGYCIGEAIMKRGDDKVLIHKRKAIFDGHNFILTHVMKNEAGGYSFYSSEYDLSWKDVTKKVRALRS